MSEKGSVEKLIEVGQGYLQQAEEALRAKSYQTVGELYMKAVAAMLQAAAQHVGVPFAGKDDYFRAMEELTARKGVDWAERTLCQALVLHQNDQHEILSHDQVRRFGQDVRRLIRWLKQIASEKGS